MHRLTFLLKLAVSTSFAIILGGCATTVGHDKDGSTVLQNDEPAPVAWWLEQEFEPTQKKLQGLELNSFDANWRRATIIDAELLRAVLSNKEFKEQERFDQQLSLTANLNGNRLPEDFVVGVYEANDGEQGRFLAIIEGDEVLEVFQHPGPTTYSGLLRKDDTVRWYKCMRCDNFDTIRWDGSNYVLSFRQHTPLPLP